MICINCGTDNKAGAKHCATCKFPLGMDTEITPVPLEKEASASIQPVVAPETTPEIRPRRTSFKPQKEAQTPKECPQCRYHLVLEADTCPMCSYPLKDNMVDAVPSAPPERPVEPELTPKELKKSLKGQPTTSPFIQKRDRKSPLAGTIDPFRKDTSTIAIATLQPVAKDGELPVEPLHIAYSDKAFTVNRDFLDPDNNTITGKTQAEFVFVDGAWYISDRSNQQTTFVRANSPIKIQKGDIILMGNRKFIFDC